VPAVAKGHHRAAKVQIHPGITTNTTSAVYRLYTDLGCMAKTGEASLISRRRS